MRNRFIAVLTVVLIIFPNIASIAQPVGNMSLKASYRDIAVSVLCDDPDVVFELSYKKASDTQYITGSYAKRYVYESHKFVASIGNLNQNTIYDVNAVIKKDGAEIFNHHATVRTLRTSTTIKEFIKPIQDIKVVPLFETASFYVPCSSLDASINVWYRPKRTIPKCSALLAGNAIDSTWKKAYLPEYISESFQFAGSIFNLRENTLYEIVAEISQNGVIINKYETNFRTWKTEVPISQTISISDIYEGGRLDIVGYEGHEKGYIKIVGDGKTVIDAGTHYTEAVHISSSSYVILENLIIRGGKNHAITTFGSAENIRIVNCDIAGWGREGVLSSPAGRYAVGYVDEDGNRINNDAGIRIMDSRKLVIERNYIHDPRGNTNSWRGSGTDSVPSWENVHPAGPNGIYLRGGGELVVRYNDIIGSEEHRWNDAIEGERNMDFMGSFGKDSDVYGNMLALGQDDGIEFDGGAVNVRFFKNRIEGFYSGISTAPNRAGPLFIYKNVMNNITDGNGDLIAMIKNGGGSTYTRGVTHILFNTFIAEKGIRGIGYGSDSDRELFHAVTRNNILLGNRSSAEGAAIQEKRVSPISSFNFDLIGNYRMPDGKGFIDVLSGNEREENGIFGIPSFVSKDNMDFRLTQDSLGYKAALELDGFSDRNMGAIDFSDSGLIPYRPIPVSADKYSVTVNNGQSIDITIYNNADRSMKHKICYPDSVNGIDITPSEGIIGPKGSQTFSIACSDFIQNYGLVITIKFENGYSIPVSVFIKK